MKKLALIFSLVALLAVPATAAAQGQGGAREDVKRCKALRSGNGEEGKSRGIGKCVSAQRRQNRRLKRLAVRECRAERTQDVQAFVDKYAPVTTTQSNRPAGLDAPGEGAGKPDGAENGDEGRRLAEAFRNCVKLAVKAAKRSHREAVATCREERADDVTAFRAEYGTNHNKRNAFGKCVSQHEDDEDENGDGQGGEAEQGGQSEPGGEPGDAPQDD